MGGGAGAAGRRPRRGRPPRRPGPRLAAEAAPGPAPPRQGAPPPPRLPGARTRTPPCTIAREYECFYQEEVIAYTNQRKAFGKNFFSNSSKSCCHFRKDSVTILPAEKGPRRVRKETSFTLFKTMLSFPKRQCHKPFSQEGGGELQTTREHHPAAAPPKPAQCRRICSCIRRLHFRVCRIFFCPAKSNGLCCNAVAPTSPWGAVLFPHRDVHKRNHLLGRILCRLTAEPSRKAGGLRCCEAPCPLKLWCAHLFRAAPGRVGACMPPSSGLQLLGGGCRLDK